MARKSANKRRRRKSAEGTSMNAQQGYKEALLELAKQKEDIAVLSADSGKEFAKHYPNRFIQCGKAQNIIGIAKGLALEGKIPFANACVTKNFESIKESANANIKIADMDEEKEDTAIACTLPITVIIPADYHEAKKATIAAGLQKGMAYLKLGKEKTAITAEKTPFTIGRVEIMRAGKDCTIIACGKALQDALHAAEKLSLQEIECTVLNCHTIKPLDKHAIITSARITGCIVTAEEYTGLGSSIAELLIQHYPVPMQLSTAEATSIAKAVKEVVLLKCESTCPELPEEHGKRLVSELHPEVYFKVHGGGIIKSIPGLKKALLEMKDETFSHHCNSHKNDFSKWIREAFKEPTLAEEIEKTKTKIGMAAVIDRWMK